MRYPIVFSLLLLCAAPSAPAQVSIGIQVPGLSIGINQPVYPELVPVPESPVYYAPSSPSNYFFYDGMYWVFQGDDWYASTWYNGPWRRIAREGVPLFVLRIPVRYYHRPPDGFRGWRADEPPHWGEHWGRGWEQRRRGWDHWDRHALPPRAQLPTYQRQYEGERYPREPRRMEELHSQNYHHQPMEPVGRGRGPEQHGHEQHGQGPQGGPGRQHGNPHQPGQN